MQAERTWSVAVMSRVIVDNDWSGDPDGLVALAHHLLSPTNEVLAVTSSFLNPMFASPRSSAADGAAMALELLGVIADDGPQPPVLAGSDVPFSGELVVSPAADEIVAVVRGSEAPVVVVCGGPLTNVADALLRAPDIAPRIRLLWIGGAVAPDEFEYNRDTDPRAAEFVLAHGDLDVVQFPLETYRSVAMSLAELEHELGTSGRVGAWLWQRFVELPLPPSVEVGGVWAMGDSPPVLLTALGESTCTLEPADPTASGARVSVCTAVDVRLLLADLMAKLRQHERTVSDAP